MATSARPTPQPQPGSESRGLLERLNRLRGTLFGPGDFTSLLITLALLMLPAMALQAAAWPLDMRVIFPITLLSVLIGFLLARSQYNELIALLLSGVYGAALVFMTAASYEPGGGISVITRSINWLTDAFSGGINQDELVFTLLVATLFWFLGYNASWHVFRIDRVWRVVLPPGLILITNTVFYSGDANLDLYLIVFMFLALILVARSNLDAREWEWYTNGIRVPRRLRAQFLRVGAGLAFIVLIFAWIVPQGNLQDRLNSFQEFLRSDPMVELSDLYNRLFAPIESEGPTSADYYGGESLELSGAIRLGDQEVLYVQVPDGISVPRYYWRARVFDTYELGKWTPGATHRLRTGYSPLDIRLETDAARQAVQQKLTIGVRSSRLIYAAPQPSQIDLPTQSYLSYATPSATPPTDDEMRSSVMNISAIRPNTVLMRGETYTATSMMSVATADQLRSASTVYPDWIQAHPQYLRATPNVVGSDAVVQLASDIVAQAGVTTNYDKAKAIERWLRANIAYNESIPQPPPNVDPIDWFLFDLREGYCNYYATAMIVMLRSQGIPARMAAGFAQGTYDAERDVYVVRERDAHTWVEAYFPGYGWIEFEPTQAQAPLNREGDDLFAEPMINQVEGAATPTFTPLPPPPTPTPEATENQDQQPPDVPPTPTITPTMTPSPTATPVILPTQPAPVSPDPRDPLSFIFPALALVLIGLVVLALLIALAVFLYWWWEWRGLRGLSPISRAYARLERYLALIGIQFGQQDTPEERRRRINRDLPSAERPVTAITRLYTIERYGPGYKHPAEEQQRSDSADKAWVDARGRILGRWARRLRFWRRGQ